ncbi:MAG: two pore domain potassium channel family protein [Chitinophagaceae bacterium]|nr:two pore domain potassium channel family protein [Chitinophagaceae bacterium]
MLRRMRLFSRLLLPVSMLLLMVLVGAFGFMLIEHYSFINALYMSVITIATVGFGEVGTPVVQRKDLCHRAHPGQPGPLHVLYHPDYPFFFGW